MVRNLLHTLIISLVKAQIWQVANFCQYSMVNLNDHLELYSTE